MEKAEIEHISTENEERSTQTRMEGPELADESTCENQDSRNNQNHQPLNYIQGSQAGGGSDVGAPVAPSESGHEELPIQPYVPPPLPYEGMERIPGYRNYLSPDVLYVPPPDANYTPNTVEDEEIAQVEILTEEEARELLIGIAKNECCWSTTAAKEMDFESIEQSTAVHYVLKTFVETRSTNWESEPFRGQAIDSSVNGPAPSPWDITIVTPDAFEDNTYYTEVPHTASVRRCHGCSGSTYITCHSCRGNGFDRCIVCRGYGYRQSESSPTMSCGSCFGSGRVECFNCNGHGQVSCPTCEGSGQLKYFVQLTIRFETHGESFIVERTPLPDELIQNVNGFILFEDTQPTVRPISSFPDNDINIQSAKLIKDHRKLGQTGRIVMQNHSIRAVPVFQCDVVWKDVSFQFFVYGEDKYVYCDCYPQTKCWGCEVL